MADKVKKVEIPDLDAKPIVLAETTKEILKKIKERTEAQTTDSNNPEGS